MIPSEAIHHWAARTPDRTALDYGGHPLSYARMAGLIDTAHAFFAGQGLAGPGVAALAFHDMLSFWVISLALRRLGLTTVAPRRAEDIAGLALPDLKAVVLSAAEPWPQAQRLCAEAGWPAIVFPRSPPAAEAPPAPAGAPGGHILLTSGTTGAYKKILVDPSWEGAYLDERAALMGFGPQTVKHCFDFGGWTGIGYKSPSVTFAVGGEVRLLQHRPLHEAFLRPGLTDAYVTPEKVARLLASAGDTDLRQPRMRMFITAGQLSQAQVDAVRERITPQVVSNFGATETSPVAQTLLATPEDRRWHAVLPGRGIEIVDDDDRPLPVGAVGRLRVPVGIGPDGYLGDPETTAAFFKDGFFYPGDLAELRADGRMALHGRVTDVLNIQGDKVAPAPIEDAIREALGVAGVCLFTRQDAGGDEKAHVVLECAQAPPRERIAEALKAALFGFAEARVHLLETLPRNDMGKVMRRAVQERLLALGLIA